MKRSYAILTVLYAAVIAWLLCVPQPIPEMPMLLFPGMDKLVHALLFAGLSGLIGTGIIKARQTIAPLWWHGPPAFFATLYGICLEGVQLYVPGRSCSGWDMLWDALGAAGIQGIFYYLGKESIRNIPLF